MKKNVFSLSSDKMITDFLGHISFEERGSKCNSAKSNGGYTPSEVGSLLGISENFVDRPPVRQEGVARDPQGRQTPPVLLQPRILKNGCPKDGRLSSQGNFLAKLKEKKIIEIKKDGKQEWFKIV